MESLTASMCFTLPVMLLPGMGTNPDFRLSSNCEITLTDSMVAHPFWWSEVNKLWTPCQQLIAVHAMLVGIIVTNQMQVISLLRAFRNFPHILEWWSSSRRMQSLQNVPIITSNVGFWEIWFEIYQPANNSENSKLSKQSIHPKYNLCLQVNSNRWEKIVSGIFLTTLHVYLFAYC